MMPKMRLRVLSQELIVLNLEAFTATEFNLAYHLLCAANACGVALNDPELLAEIERIAEEQQAGIDAKHPRYEHSSGSAATRNLPGIFHTLALEARAKILTIKSGTYQKS